MEIPFSIAQLGDRPLRERRKTKETLDALQGVRVLLVEDHPVNRKVAVKALEITGVETDTAENGEEAVKILQSVPPETYAAVLMDLEMPIMDGYEATQIIRNDRRFDALPIIALSAHVMTFEKERCFQVGMNGCVNIPFDPENLWNTLLRAIRKNMPYLAMSSLQPEQKFKQNDSEVAIQDLNRREGAKNEGESQSVEADVAWLEAFRANLSKGDFEAIDLWENNKNSLRGRLSPANLDMVSKALQDFDFALALTLLNAEMITK